VLKEFSATHFIKDGASDATCCAHPLHDQRMLSAIELYQTLAAVESERM
jgi:hypothetical protein